MNLDTTTKRVEIVLGEAMTTAECDITASYAVAGAGVFQLAEADLATNGTTPVVVVAAPPSGRQNQVKEITFFNNDTVTHELTLRINNGGTMRVIARRSIPPDGDFRYVSDLGVAASASAPAILVESGAAAKISALPAMTSPTVGAELFVVVQSGADTKVSVGDLFAGGLYMPNAAALSGANGGNVDLEAGTGDGVGNGGNMYIQSGNGGASGAGGAFFNQAGDGGATAGNGGALGVQAGNANSPSGTGGQAIVRAGDGAGTNGVGGQIQLLAGTGNGTGAGGGVSITSGGSNGSGNSGNVHLTSGASIGTGNSGSAGIESGDPLGGTGHSGNCFMGSADSTTLAGNLSLYTGSAPSPGSLHYSGGSSTDGSAQGGGFTIITGNSLAGGNPGGDFEVTLGAGATRNGLAIITSLPTADPGVSGALWNNLGVVQVSP